MSQTGNDNVALQPPPGLLLSPLSDDASSICPIRSSPEQLPSAPALRRLVANHELAPGSPRKKHGRSPQQSDTSVPFIIRAEHFPCRTPSLPTSHWTVWRGPRSNQLTETFSSVSGVPATYAPSSSTWSTDGSRPSTSPSTSTTRP